MCVIFSYFITLLKIYYILQVPAEGSLVWVFVLTMLQGICGTTIGLVISSVCRTQQDATQVALGIFYPNLILSGIIWPVEAMPVALRYKSILTNIGGYHLQDLSISGVISHVINT